MKKVKQYWYWFLTTILGVGIAYAAFPVQTPSQQFRGHVLDVRLFTREETVNPHCNWKLENCATFFRNMVEMQVDNGISQKATGELERTELSIRIQKENKVKQTFFERPHWKKINGVWHDVIYVEDTEANFTASKGIISKAYAASQTFLATDTFTPPAGVTSFTVLVVAGGAGGGCVESGGGGAGGMRDNQVVTISSAQTVTVGSGGSGAANANVTGSNGTASSIGSIITTIGGGGGGSTNSRPGNSGGSGGGSSVNTAGAAGTGGEGNNGGAGKGGGTAPGGGGGGKGAVGSDATADNGTGGAGGAGAVSAVDGNTYAGGGGGQGGNGAGIGGSGGGGAGSAGSTGTAGTANTGGGGGGSGGTCGAANGGSGIVIITWTAGTDSGEGIMFEMFRLFTPLVFAKI